MTLFVGMHACTHPSGRITLSPVSESNVGDANVGTAYYQTCLQSEVSSDCNFEPYSTYGIGSKKRWREKNKSTIKSRLVVPNLDHFKIIKSFGTTKPLGMEYVLLI